MKIGKTTIEIIQGSLLDQQVQVYVNAANVQMRGGGGIDGMIHKLAGPELLADLKRIAPYGAPTGHPVPTLGYALKSDYILHVAGPKYHDGKRGEPFLLAQSYWNCLVGIGKAAQSIGFPSISTGIYGYPLDEAAPIAVSAAVLYLRKFPETTLDRIVFALFQQHELDAFQAAYDALKNGGDLAIDPIDQRTD